VTRPPACTSIRATTCASGSAWLSVFHRVKHYSFMAWGSRAHPTKRGADARWSGAPPPPPRPPAPGARVRVHARTHTLRCRHSHTMSMSRRYRADRQTNKTTLNLLVLSRSTTGGGLLSSPVVALYSLQRNTILPACMPACRGARSGSPSHEPCGRGLQSGSPSHEPCGRGLRSGSPSHEPCG
jgi:hypothetical protein